MQSAEAVGRAVFGSRLCVSQRRPSIVSTSVETRLGVLALVLVEVEQLRGRKRKGGREGRREGDSSQRM